MNASNIRLAFGKRESKRGKQSFDSRKRRGYDGSKRKQRHIVRRLDFRRMIWRESRGLFMVWDKSKEETVYIIHNVSSLYHRHPYSKPL